jgi:hypothetical protein
MLRAPLAASCFEAQLDTCQNNHTGFKTIRSCLSSVKESQRAAKTNDSRVGSKAENRSFLKRSQTALSEESLLHQRQWIRMLYLVIQRP